jgi:hypothetical protein
MIRGRPSSRRKVCLQHSNHVLAPKMQRNADQLAPFRFYQAESSRVSSKVVEGPVGWTTPLTFHVLCGAVEYAMEAISMAGTVLAILTKEGIVMVAEKVGSELSREVIAPSLTAHHPRFTESDWQAPRLELDGRW